ncbi:hypothetical protein ACFX5K_01280 [Rickettsiales bacterium LUAb2]
MRKQEKLLTKLAHSKDKDKTDNYKKQLSNIANRRAIKSDRKAAKSFLKRIGRDLL